MRKNLFLVLLTIIQIWPMTGHSSSLWENSKEGKSRHYDKKDLKKLQTKKSSLTSQQIAALDNLETQLTLIPAARSCSDHFTIEYKLINEDYGNLPFSFKELLMYLREKNSIDDIIFENANLYHKIISRKRPNRPSIFVSSIGLDKEKLVPVYEMAQDLWKKAECPDILLRVIQARLQKVRGKKLSRRFIRKSNHFAYRKGHIGLDLFKFLERARREKYYKNILNIREYLNKKHLLGRQFPFQSDFSDYSSKKLKGEKFSRRQSIYQKYSHFQISLMANLMQKLRTRMEAAAIDIVIRDEDGTAIETIPLEPMEQYRFTVKMLRKEIDTLSNGSFFNGSTIDYFDVIVAAHEAGKVNSVEIEELIKLEDIWNPKKSLKEKIVDIVVRYGGITAVLLPPGYNLIPMLAIMVIEATTKDPKREDDSAFSLF